MTSTDQRKVSHPFKHIDPSSKSGSYDKEEDEMESEEIEEEDSIKTEWFGDENNANVSYKSPSVYAMSHKSISETGYATYSYQFIESPKNHIRNNLNLQHP